ncbi:MAG: hypothetical protein DRO04_01430 [Candidatus Iainarchaeum archaeon]|uniref:Uncharacterized protein n=1 Tax=Candidatus Iainarchaeum sp. TaxID=3101447 RepID=A0A497JIA0_9ARCH|nr:MAG: hypothetical protein DRO04_01430 [Candidatus Diapherotrites archaeon]
MEEILQRGEIMQKGTYTALISLLALVLLIGFLSLSSLEKPQYFGVVTMKAADLKATMQQIQLSFDKALTQALVKSVKENFANNSACKLPKNVDSYIMAYFSDILNDIKAKEKVICSYSLENSFENSKPLYVSLSCSYAATKAQKFWFNINSENEFELRKEVLLENTAKGCKITVSDAHSGIQEISTEFS